ncbi:tRNA (guanine-N2-)-methyltransferase [Galdieria sulphuraria]|uniref:tRNA (guanine(26)-N(2))-dimethyltransferase n=1 Tax=Galdieria sulphuraria TaxID=130081 RepID=M2XTM4_GALSU|nr:tRNA (guanine-N2-)-methyltransferase [Galdieria sulphuraria]EME27013.1 tRNA (guanine-N2-)-methyltransferase [Galdieria sulphuraria]|eukprot:XP_005703533.1 tRNA (guanine-N2-)-methyltransferase [Galdieria sulphuraria]
MSSLRCSSSLLVHRRRCVFNPRRTCSTVASLIERELLKLQSKAMKGDADDANDVLTNSSQVESRKETICEGKGKVVYNSGQVFYNKAQAFNRDLSVLVLNYFVSTCLNEMEQDKKLQNSRALSYKRVIDDKQKTCKYAQMRLDSSTWKNPVDHFSVFEAFSATGLRAIRYATEVPHLFPIIANDMDQASYETIQQSLLLNENVQGKVFANLGEATDVMYKHRFGASQWDIIDLDPYGTAAPFVDSAMQSIKNRGLLCVTSTDMRSLAGVQGGICFARYGSVPCTWPKAYRNEVGLRILLSFLQKTASRYGKYVEPLLAIFVDFYVRVFVRVYESGLQSQRSIQHQAYVYACNSCPSFFLQPLGAIRNFGEANEKVVCAKGPPVEGACPYCHSELSLYGPIYTGAIFQQNVVEKLLHQLENDSKWSYLPCKERLKGFLTVLCHECADIPLFVDCNDMSKLLRTSPPPQASIREVLRKRGYRVSTSHLRPTALKTDAPFELIWDIMRIWVQKNGLNNIKPHDAASRIMATEPFHISPEEIDFQIHKDAFNSCHSVTRYPPLEKHHGPGKRATGKRKMDPNKLPGQDLEDEL